MNRSTHVFVMTLNRKNIREFRDEAGSAGDFGAVAVAERALGGNQDAIDMVGGWISDAQAMHTEGE